MWLSVLFLHIIIPQLGCNAAPRSHRFKVLCVGAMVSINHHLCVNNILQTMVMSSTLVGGVMEV